MGFQPPPRGVGRLTGARIVRSGRELEPSRQVVKRIPNRVEADREAFSLLRRQVGWLAFTFEADQRLFDPGCAAEPGRESGAARGHRPVLGPPARDLGLHASTGPALVQRTQGELARGRVVGHLGEGASMREGETRREGGVLERDPQTALEGRRGQAVIGAPRQRAVGDVFNGEQPHGVRRNRSSVAREELREEDLANAQREVQPVRLRHRTKRLRGALDPLAVFGPFARHIAPDPAPPPQVRPPALQRRALDWAMPVFVCVVLIMSSGCPSESRPIPPERPADSDGDGVPDEDDCAPTDPTVHPGAEDVCDGLDSDCVADPTDVDADGDGVPLCADDCDDEDPTLHTWDGDGDGVTPCDGDCDDADGARFPGNMEADVCDGLDSDCVYDSAEGDEDGDGYLACADDCDDEWPTVHPGHAEVCDGIDNNCDGQADDVELTPVPLVGDVSLAEAHTKFLGWYEGDYLGSRVVAPGDVNGDGHQDFLLATDTPWDATQGDRTYLVMGPLCGEIQLGGFDGPGVADIFGSTAIARVGDVDGDGFDDMGIGRHVVFGRADAAAGGSWRMAGLPAGPSWVGDFVPLRGLGDVNGDGLDDVAVLANMGGPQPSAEELAGVGEVTLFLGPLSSGELGLEDAAARFYGSDIYPSFEGFGWSAAAGDFTGDGDVDLAVGVGLPLAGQEPGDERPATVYVFEGPLVGERWAQDTTIRIEGGPEAAFGRTMASGDLNADGVADLLVSLPPERQRAYLGPFVGTTDGAAFDVLVGGPAIGGNGWSVDFGDVNGDGVDDLVGNSQDDTWFGQQEPEGWAFWHRVEVVLGSPTGTFEEATIVGVGWPDPNDPEGDSFWPAGEGESLSAVAGGGLLIGSPRGHRVNYEEAGKVYVLQLE